MNIAPNFAAAALAASYQAASSASHTKHKSQHTPSIPDIDTQGSSVASAPIPTGKVGTGISITV